MANKQLIKNNNVIRKEFNYQKGEVSLNFKLRIDNTSELRDFLELLEESVKDVKEELKGKKN